jgi:hypothetical protein
VPLIKTFQQAGSKTPKLQPTQVVGHWSALREGAAATLLQIDTRGSEDRKKVGGQSQTIQLDERSARELVDILKREFRF